MRADVIIEEISEFPPKVCENSYSYENNSIMTVHTRDAAELEDAPEGYVLLVLTVSPSLCRRP
jgi:hypothetical protein